MQGMIEAWGWTSSDVILHVLPLHHVHGIVNVLMTALYCGAACKMLPKFDAKEVNDPGYSKTYKKDVHFMPI